MTIYDRYKELSNDLAKEAARIAELDPVVVDGVAQYPIYLFEDGKPLEIEATLPKGDVGFWFTMLRSTLSLTLQDEQVKPELTL